MFVNINKDPFQNGVTLGKLSSKVLRERIISMKKIQKQQRISEKIMKARANDFADALKKVAPQWLEEVAGMAKGCSVIFDDILKLNCLPPDFYPPTGNNCTSFVYIGKDKNMLFKIRDERNHVQQFYTYSVGDCLNIQVGRDIGNIGAAHAFTSDAIAFANNTGSQTYLVDDIPRLNDCHILRYFSENVKKVEDAPKIFEQLADKGLAGGAGKERGCIFMFADKEKGLILETAASSCATTWINKGTKAVSNHFISSKAKKWDAKSPSKNTILRKKRLEELLTKLNDTPSAQEVFNISRDRKNLPHALCNDDKKHFWMTISAQLQVIDKKSPELSKNYICCGNTRHSVYLPFPVDYRKSFKPLVSGQFYKSSNDLYERFTCSNHFKTIQKQFEEQVVSRNNCEAMCQEAYSMINFKNK
jgi:acyl-CoA:6-aminopenicillanic acid acyl transferase